MTDETEPLLDAVTAVVPPLLMALDALAYVGRRLHPPDLAEIIAGVQEFREPLASGLDRFEATVWPEHLQSFAARVNEAAGEALDAFAALDKCLTQSNPAMGAYRAMSFSTRAVEALYPVAAMLPPVSRFFLSDAHRGDEALQAKVSAVPAREDVGIVHAGNQKTERGGFSVYVPEYAQPAEPLPLVVALHGGSGHGRGFLWTWLRDARTRGVILISPTSLEDTWSLMGPDSDSANLQAMVDYVGARWPLDRSRMLLTGMSDGGTFSYVSGLRAESPFTHLAPISASFHPLLLDAATPERLAGLPVYLVHGALDWMFSVDVAHLARDTLRAAGAAVEYRELADLSHTYPREENDRMLSWFLGSDA